MDTSVQLAQALREFRQAHSKHTLQLGPDRWDFIQGGRGDYTIVIVGGMGSTVESMYAISAALESTCRVISLSIPVSATTVEDVNKGIEGILESLGIRQAIFLGHSLGGMIVQSFTVSHPERVSGLVLSNTGIYLGARAVLLPAAATVTAGLPGALLLNLVRSSVSRLVAAAEGKDFWNEFYQDELRQPGFGVRLKEQSSLLAKYAASFKHNRIHCDLPWVSALPVQIIAAEDDRGFTKREIDHLSSLYPKSQTLTLPPVTGHFSFLTRPREYVDAVKSLVARVYEIDRVSAEIGES